MGYKRANQIPGLGDQFATVEADLEAALERERNPQTQTQTQAIPDTREWHEESLVGLAARALRGEDTWVEAAVENVGARAGEIIMGVPELAGTAVEAGAGLLGYEVDGTGWLDAPIPTGTGEQASLREQVQAIFGSRERVNEAYPELGWESFKRDWVDPNASWGTVAKNTAELVVTQGPSIVVDAFLAKKKTFEYVLTRTGEIAADRKESTGEPVRIGDMAIAGATAVVVQQMEKLGLDTALMNNTIVRKAIEKATGTALSRLPSIMVAGGTEAGTEYVQELMEGLATDVKDDLSNLDEAISQNAIDAIAGAIVGGGVGGALGIMAKADGGVPGQTDEPGQAGGPPPDEAAAAAAGAGEPPRQQDLELFENLGEPTPPSPPVNEPEQQGPLAPETTPVPEGQGDLFDGERLAEPEVTPSNPQEEPIAPPEAPVAVGVLDDGQQDYLSPAPELAELPPDVDPDSLVNDMRRQDKRRERDIERGQELRDTGIGKFVEQAVRGKASAKQVEKIANEQLTNREKLEKIQKGINDAKNATPGPQLIQFAENVAMIAEGRRQKIQAALEQGQARNEAQAQQWRQLDNALATQVDELQGIAEDITKAVRVKPGTGTVSGIIGRMLNSAPVLKQLGYDIEPMLKAETPVEARKALDTVAKKAKNDAQRNQVLLPPRLSLDENLKGQIDEKSRDIESVRADSERQGRAFAQSTSETMTAAKMYADTEYSESGNVTNRVKAPKGSAEQQERSAMIRREEAAEERRQFGDITNYKSRGIDQYDDVYVEGELEQPLEEGETDNRTLARMAEPVLVGEGENQYVATPKEIAEKAGRKRPPSNSERVRREQNTAVRKKQLEAQDASTAFDEKSSRLATAQRKAEQDLEKKRKKLEELEARKNDAVEKVKKEPVEKSPPLPQAGKGVTKKRRNAAKDVFAAYRNAWKKNKKIGPSPHTLRALAQETKRKKTSPKGSPPLLVYNPNFEDRKEALILVKGVYPKRNPIKPGEPVTRATPHKPGDEAPFDFLEGRTFYMADETSADVVAIEGSHSDPGIPPEEMDLLLTSLNEVPFSFGKGDREQQLLAMAQYLMGTEAPRARADTPKSPEQQLREEIKELEEKLDGKEPLEVEDEIDIDDIDDDGNPVDWKHFEKIIIDQFGPKGEGRQAEYDSLYKRANELEEQIEASKRELDNLEEVARGTPIVDNVLEVTPPAGWGLSPELPFQVITDGEKITDPLEMDEYERREGNSLDEDMVQAIMEDARIRIKASEMELEAIRKQLERDYEGYRPSKAGRSKKTPGGTEKTPTGPVPDSTGNAAAASGGRRDDVNDRLPGIEIAPDTRPSADLWGPIREPDAYSPTALQRAGALAVRGPGGGRVVTEEQELGIAAVFHHWRKAIKKGVGGFLNVDGTGFGKSRQIAGAAELIAQDEEANGTYRPVLMLFPGAKAEPLVIEDKETGEYRPGLSNQLGENLMRDMYAMGIDAEAKYSDGTPRFIFKTYGEIINPGKQAYAAVFADEAHEQVKGVGPVAQGYDQINTPFRAVFTATPTDMAGQEMYWLKHMLRKPGQSLEKVEQTIATRLGLVRNNKGKWALPDGSEAVWDHYVQKLGELMGAVARKGMVMSRTYGRLGKSIWERPSVVDEEAKALYERLLEDGLNPTDNAMVRLNEHMKVPYMVERAKQRLAKGNKVIAVFTSTGNSDHPRLQGTVFERPAIERFIEALDDAGIEYGALYGDAKPKEDKLALEAFQGDKDNLGSSQVMVVSDRRASSGLNLNDAFGKAPRYMLIGATSMQGERLMQLLGRHDRLNNKTIPYSEYVLLDNPTDQGVRAKIKRKTQQQEEITGMRHVRETDKELFNPEMQHDPKFAERKRRSARLVTDSVDGIIFKKAMSGNANLRDLVHEVAINGETTELRNLATDLLRIATGWEGVTFSQIEDTAGGVVGRYHWDGQRMELGPTSTAQTLLHEAIHHFTMYRLTADLQARSELEVIAGALLASDPEIEARFSNAFEDVYEFVAEAFSDPDFQATLRETYIDNMGNSLNGWQRFLKWVQKLLGVTNDTYNAMERILDLDLMAVEKNHDAWTMALHELRMPVAERKAVKQRGALFERAASRWETAKDGASGAYNKYRKGQLKLMTYDQIADLYQKFAGRTLSLGKPGNVLLDMVKNMETINAETTKKNKEYERQVMDKVRKFARGQGKEMVVGGVQLEEGGPHVEMTQMELLSHLANVSGYAGIHFGKPATDKVNRVLGKDKKGNLVRPHAKAAWDLFRKHTRNHKHFEMMRTYNDLAKFFEGDRQIKATTIAGAWLDTIYPDAKRPWAERTMKEIKAELKNLGNLNDEDLKNLGASRDAMKQLDDIMQPGVVPGAYFPLKRYGDYVVVLHGDFDPIDDEQRDRLLRKYPMGKVNSEGRIMIKSVNRFERLSDANRFYREMRKQYPNGGNIEVKKTELQYASNEDLMGPTSFSSLVQNFTAQLDKNLKGKSAEDKAHRETMRRMFAQAMLDMMPETSVANAMRPRSGTHGASTDLIRNLHGYGASRGHILAHLRYGREQNNLANELRVLTTQAEGKDEWILESVRRELMNRNNSFANKDMNLGRVGQVISDVGFMFYLVGFSYNAVNATQPMLVAYPHLAARYGEKAAAKAMANAYKTVGGAPTKELWRTKGTLTQLRGLFHRRKNLEDFDRSEYDILNKPEGIKASLTDPNHRKMITILENEGHIEAGLTMDMARQSERAHVDANGKTIPPNHWDYLTDWMRTFPQITEVLNRSVVATATFDLEYAKSKDFDKAVNEARKAVKQTQFVYQNWNKPPIFQHPAGRVAFMFKQHVQHMYYYMIKNAAMSIRGATKTERKVARKAAIHFVLIHMAMGGVVGGTPELFKWLLNLVFWAFDDDDDPFNFDRAVRNSMYDLMGKDGATLASQGLPGFIGLDLSGRVGIDSMLIFEAPDTSDKDAFVADTVRIAGGPMIGLAERAVVTAPQAYLRGDYPRMLEEMLPKAIRDPLRAHRYANQGYRDLSGKTYRDAADVEWWEYGYKALGFSPKPESDMYASRSVGFSRQRMEQKKRRFYARFYAADTAKQRQAVIDDIRDWNADNPDFAITRSNLIRSVKQRRRYELETEKGVYSPKSTRGWVREQQRSYD